MVDITLCQPKHCPYKEKCYRYKVKGNSQWQSYSDFSNFERKLCNELDCNYYYPYKEKK